MSRQKRLHLAGGMYYIQHRSNPSQPALFTGTDDFAIFESIVSRVIPECNAKAHTYCWTKHAIHLVIEVDDVPTGRIMKWVMSEYALKLRRDFDIQLSATRIRHAAVLIDPERYLPRLIRYLHWLPAFDMDIGNLKGYPWSSHRHYLEKTETSWLSVQMGLNLISGDCLKTARNAYREFVKTRPTSEDTQCFEWNSRQAPQVLGDQKFCCKLPLNWPVHHSRITLDQLIDSVARHFGVDADEIRAGAKAPDLPRVRAVIAWQATNRHIATLKEVAQRVRRSSPTLCVLMDCYKAQSPEFFSTTAIPDCTPIAPLTNTMPIGSRAETGPTDAPTSLEALASQAK
jgi:putative transposase